MFLVLFYCDFMLTVCTAQNHACEMVSYVNLSSKYIKIGIATSA